MYLPMTPSLQTRILTVKPTHWLFSLLGVYLGNRMWIVGAQALGTDYWGNSGVKGSTTFDPLQNRQLLMALFVQYLGLYRV